MERVRVALAAGVLGGHDRAPVRVTAHVSGGRLAVVCVGA